MDFKYKFVSNAKNEIQIGFHKYEFWSKLTNWKKNLKNHYSNLQKIQEESESVFKFKKLFSDLKRASFESFIKKINKFFPTTIDN